MWGLKSTLKRKDIGLESTLFNGWGLESALSGMRWLKNALIRKVIVRESTLYDGWGLESALNEYGSKMHYLVCKG